MRSTALVVLSILFVACGTTASRSDAPPVAVQITPLNQNADIFYFRGPVNLQFRVTVTNPTDEPLTLRRLDMRTEGPGAYVLRANGTPMRVTIAPKSTASVTVSVWGRSLGGYLRQNEPVTLQTSAFFDSPRGSFVKLGNNIIQPY